MNSLIKKLGLAALLAAVIFSMACQKQTTKEEWQDLFDGKTLNGWKVLGGQADFYVEDGMIVCNTKKDIDGGYLVTENTFGDFLLELDVKIDTTLNSGVQIRGRVWDKDTTTMYLSGKGDLVERTWPVGYVWGYQIEVDPSSRAWSGGLYEPGNRGWLVTLAGKEEARQAFKPLDWNHFKIEAKGDTIRTWVNGVACVDTTDSVSQSGFIGLQFHKAYREDQVDKKSLWKNIRIKEL